MTLEQIINVSKTLTAAGDVETFKSSANWLLKHIIIALSLAGYVYVEISSTDRFNVRFQGANNSSGHFHLPQGFRIREGDKITVYAGQAAAVTATLLGEKTEK